VPTKVEDRPTADLEYLGEHDQFEDILPDFVAGWLAYQSKERRPSYGGCKVLDMDRLKKDFKQNDVSDRSFFYLDREFFKDTEQKYSTKV
jgi:hypothetical protein